MHASTLKSVRNLRRFDIVRRLSAVPGRDTRIGPVSIWDQQSTLPSRIETLDADSEFKPALIPDTSQVKADGGNPYLEALP